MRVALGAATDLQVWEKARKIGSILLETLTAHWSTWSVAMTKVQQDWNQSQHAYAVLAHHHHPYANRCQHGGGGWHPDNARSNAPTRQLAVTPTMSRAQPMTATKVQTKE